MKSVVRGQGHLGLVKNHFARAQERRLFGNRFQRAVLHSPHESNNRRNRHRLGQRLQLFLVSIDKSRPFQQILRRVSTEAELRKYRQIRTPLLRRFRKREDASGVSCKVADGGIKLRESYFHARTSEYRLPLRDANSSPNSMPKNNLILCINCRRSHSRNGALAPQKSS